MSVPAISSSASNDAEFENISKFYNFESFKSASMPCSIAVTAGLPFHRHSESL